VTRLARAAAAALTVLAVATPVALLPGPSSATSATAATAATSPSPSYDGPVEDYAPYQPQRKCRDTARPGTQELAGWINASYGAGSALASIRACDSGGVSEHKAGRAIDWSVDATDADQRHQARAFLDALFATDSDGNAHALARRMGIMYVIWNDHMWASYDSFDRKDYLSSGCASVERCSVTLRHRDHVHISLSRAGSRGDTSWFSRD
jgi:hypothetical protein